ncbi:MAG: hypothetical protein ACQPRH_00675 [Solitalea-like symbiont of Tyrophagus putrescentiae]
MMLQHQVQEDHFHEIHGIYIQIKARGRKNLVTNIGFLEKWRVLDFDCRNHNNNKSLNVLM